MIKVHNLDKNEFALRFSGNEDNYTLVIYSHFLWDSRTGFTLEVVSKDYLYRARLVDTRHRRVKKFKSIASVFKLVDVLTGNDRSARINIEYVNL